MFRSLTAPLVLAAAVGVPYLATNGPELDGVWSKKASTGSAEGAPLEGLTSQPPGSGAGLDGVRLVPLTEVFRFDVSKEWVYQQWARKSTALAELGLYGVRVPLITGTQLYDLAGSLTYYFNQSGRVERISFSGHTGDTTQLVLLMHQRFGLAPQTTPVVGQQVLQLRRGSLVISELRTEPAAVLRANAPHESFRVELTLQRPDATTPLPPRVPVMHSLPTVSQQGSGSEVTKSAAKVGSNVANHQESLGWKLFIPRSRVPKSQIDNLNRGDQFR